MPRVVLDTGALVALLGRKDWHHPWATEAFRSVRVPMATCDAVLSGTWFLLNRLPPSLEVLPRWIRRGWLVNRFDFETMGNRAFDLMARYRNLPMTYADACLVTIAEEGQFRASAQNAGRTLTHPARAVGESAPSRGGRFPRRVHPCGVTQCGGLDGRVRGRRPVFRHR